MPDTRITLTLTLNQAAAVRDALDAYSRLCIGQLEEVAQLVNTGIIPLAGTSGNPRMTASNEVREDVETLMKAVKAALGYSSNSNHGIGHPHVDLSGHRAYEIKKVLAKILAETRNPNPTFRGVDYDGLGPRYTRDPAPVATIQKDDEK